MDGPGGLIYTAIDSTAAQQSAAFLMVYHLDGSVAATVPAPILAGAPGIPDITDLAVDAAGDVFLSDYGQQAVYYYTPSQTGYVGPNIVVQGTQNAASVAVTPDAQTVYISGGCGFAHARTYTRQPSGGYQSGACFGIGTIAFIGASVDKAGDVASQVDGAPGLVSIGNPDGKGRAFTLPTFTDSVGGVSFSRDNRILYVVDATKEVVYAYGRPIGGWVDRGRAPKVVATYAGFKALNIIATLP
jgi:hypothetical protein